MRPLLLILTLLSGCKNNGEHPAAGSIPRPYEEVCGTVSGIVSRGQSYPPDTNLWIKSAGGNYQVKIYGDFWQVGDRACGYITEHGCRDEWRPACG